MKVAVAVASALRTPLVSREAVAQLYGLTGLLLVVGVPVLFWTGALALVAKALDIAIGPAGLAAAAVMVAMPCCLGASAAMAGRS